MTSQKTIDQFLEHHGVLGMHWGIRHDKPSSGRTSSKPVNNHKTVTVSKNKDTLIKAGESVALGSGGIAVIGFAAHQNPVIGAPLYFSRISKDLENIKNFTARIDKGKDFLSDSKDTKLKTGAVFHRVASTVETHIDNPKYATYLAEDVLKYRNNWVTPGHSRYNPHYLTSMIATKDVKIASPDSILKVIERNLHSILDDGETLYQKTIRAIESNDLKEAFKNDPSLTTKYVRGWNVQNLWADDIGKATSELMRKAGYSAVTDINNTAGSARHAVIILDKAAFNLTSRRLTEFERSAAIIARNRLARTALKVAVSKV